MSIIKYLADRTTTDDVLMVCAQIGIVASIIYSVNHLSVESYYSINAGAEITNRREDIMTEEEVEDEEDNKHRLWDDGVKSNNRHECRLSRIHVGADGRLFCTVDTIYHDTTQVTLSANIN